MKREKFFLFFMHTSTMHVGILLRCYLFTYDQLAPIFPSLFRFIPLLCTLLNQKKKHFLNIPITKLGLIEKRGDGEAKKN